MLDLTRLRILAAVARHGSLTKAAAELHYSQPSVSHHMSRLEAETGAMLVQRVGRGIRLTPAGEQLAARAVEIIGRVDAAGAELAAHVGLRAGRVRIASFASALCTFVPQALAAVAVEHPELEVQLLDAHSDQAQAMLRSGEVEIAVAFSTDDTPVADGLRATPLLDDPVHLVTRPGAARTLAAHRDADWIAGCTRCRAQLVDLCAPHDFLPRITVSSDDMVVEQALVAAGVGVTTMPGLALGVHRNPGVRAVPVPGAYRRIAALTFGEPPDPPPTAAVLAALVDAARSLDLARSG